MEGSGMRWSKKGADATLALRAIYLNGDFENYFEYFIEKERKRLYEESKSWRWRDLNAKSLKLAA